MRLSYEIKTLINKLRRKVPNVHKEFYFVFIFLTDKNDGSSQPSAQSGCGSGDDRKRRCVGIHHSSSDVRTFVLNHFRNLIPLHQPVLAMQKSFIPLSNFKFFLLTA